MGSGVGCWWEWMGTGVRLPLFCACRCVCLLNRGECETVTVAMCGQLPVSSAISEAVWLSVYVCGCVGI